MDYVTGAKLDQIAETLRAILDVLEYDAVKKYPELKARDKK